MLFAVQRYGRDNSFSDRIAVFDTEDCTTQTVYASDAKESGVDIKSIEYASVRNKILARSKQVGLISMLSGNEYKTSCFDFSISTGRVVIDDEMHTEFFIETSDRGYSFICNKKLKGKGFFVPMYLFLYKYYIIIRYLDFNKREPSWYTAAVVRGTGLLGAEWSQDLSICTDRDLAVRVDMTSEV